MVLDGKVFKEMMVSGAYELENNKEDVNALNVFPVPDGDTGTNMSATMLSAASEIKKVKELNVSNVADAASLGALMGARGNSGVILSQLMRGIAKYLKGKELINTKDFAAALKEGAATAYRAVMKPTEGTILTVARETADRALEVSKKEEDFTSFFENICDAAVKSLNRTPSLLPVLKQAGVVDAGGKGLVVILSGMLKYLRTGYTAEKTDLKQEKSKTIKYDDIDTSDIKFGYCTEFFIKTQNANPEDFKSRIANLGDSILVVGTENLIKTHIHTNEPGTVLQEALKFGELSKIKIDNMREQHQSIIEDDNKENSEENPVEEFEKEYAIITVAAGEGIIDIFKDLGADYVIEGGQTMNPSTQDILSAIEKVKAKNIFVLPNNGNIIMAAQQAKDVSNKNVFVIPTKSIPQGITAVIAMNSELSPEENEQEINEAILRVKTGQVTYAVRNTNFDGIEIKEGNILGMINGKLYKVGDDIEGVTKELLDAMVDEDSELVTIIYGNKLEEEDVKPLSDYAEEKYSHCDVSINYGGQPVYYYIISVE